MHVTKKNRNSVKAPSQSPPVFEGVYNNSRMLHFLTAVVGSRCDVMVKNGSLYEGIFKTLSSRCELAVDAVHKVKNEEGDGGGGTPVHPRREEITDTMIFGPNDLVTMICRDVDLNYATRDTFTDSAIGSRVNGDHREKVLQRWDGGDSNGENFDLDADTSNGWDASEMFRFNEETYGVKSTYDASLSMYTVPLERGSSEGFRQREARAARLASEIEASTQYRNRVALENDEGRTEEDKYSAVTRDRDRDGGERGRDSPGFSSAGSREGKYIPLPQRAREREIGVSGRGERGGAVSNLPNRTNRPGPSSSSPRPLPSGSGQPIPPTDRSSPLSVRGGYSTHQSQSSPPTQPRPSEPGHSSPPSPHTLPHSLSHPQSLSDSARPVNGVSSRMSPKSQRPGQTNRNLRTSNSHSSPTVSRSPKPDVPSQDPPLANPSYLDTSSVTMGTPKPTGPTPLFPVDVNEILSKERMESPASPQEGKSSKVPSVQQRSQLEELRKFSNNFILPSNANLSSPKTANTDSAQANPAHNTQTDPAPLTEAKTAPPTTPNAELPAEERSRETNAEGAATTTPPPATSISAPSAMSGTAMKNPTAEGQTSGTPQPARTPGSEEGKPEASERSEGMADQVKKSTLNPNAKEFNPTKAPLTMVKPSATPTPPRPTPQSPTVVLQPPPGQGAIYNTPYLSYGLPIQIQGHSAPQMYQYSMTTVGQGKYPRTKGSVVTPRPDHSSSAPPMMQAAASAAGPPLVASPYPPSYLQYNQVIQAMPHYPGQMYSMLQGGPRMLGSGGHPQTLGPPGPQYPGQNEGPPAPQQGMYAPQSFSHHSGSIHHPQPSSTPTGSQPPPQHPAPSPGQVHLPASQPVHPKLAYQLHIYSSGQSGPQPQSLYHSGPLSAPTPPNMPPGHSSPQASYSLQGYSLPGHQPLPHPYSSLGQLTQTHVQGALSGPHHSGGHGPPPVMLLHAPQHPPQQGSGPQHGPPPQQGPHQHFTYIGPPQMPVQTHPSQQIQFHPSGN
ncbi:ataxin-2-like protein isoform X3 [Cyprinus carpio]|uniref:Ataxin-2-like protein isoform X3 n=2 Tax=Cyprinus carpio TaxID=7962 RepID=A0A8C1NXU6_CYPCA|nr:ataxin-2-like protein isoform X3 [Cyprinus carpio]